MRKLLRTQRGTSTVEFALLAPILFLIVFFLIDFGRIFWMLSTMEYAVEAGGRYAMINSTATSSQIISQAQANLYAVNTSAITFTTTNTASSGINYVIIKAQSTFNFFPGSLFPVASVNLSRQVEVPLF